MFYRALVSNFSLSIKDTVKDLLFFFRSLGFRLLVLS